MPTVGRYRLLFYSEKLLPKVPVKRKDGSVIDVYAGCRIATHANGCAMATLGETTITRRGRLKGKAGRRADLMRGWKGTGDKKRSGFNQSHVAGIAKSMFPWLPMPVRFNVTDWDRVVAKLDAGFAISIAVELSALHPLGRARRLHPG